MTKQKEQEGSRQPESNRYQLRTTVQLLYDHDESASTEANWVSKRHGNSHSPVKSEMH